MVPSNKDLATAYHEAGHAVMAFLHGIRVHKASIEGGDGFDGYVRHAPMRFVGATPDANPSDRRRITAERYVEVCLAGDIAQGRYDPKSVRRYHARTDHQHAVDLLQHFTASDKELELYLQLLDERARNRLSTHWFIVEAVVRVLVDRRVVSGEDLRQAILAATS